MIYRTNVALQIKGDRVERGREIELSEEETAVLDPADITPVDAIAEPEREEVAPEVPLEDMNLQELKAKAEELGLSKSGSKADILERINLHLSTPPQENEENEENEEE